MIVRPKNKRLADDGMERRSVQRKKAAPRTLKASFERPKNSYTVRAIRTLRGVRK